ncbi:MAG: cytochrome c3 family protein [Coriobacteriia bacterium]|jgi:hypothetical protein|nr:cytochrome c3 family protein [Coriobacteriia bacterium]
MNRPGTSRAKYLVLTLVCVLVVGLGAAALAIAQEDTASIVIDPSAPVYASTCRACHAEIADGKNPLVEFGHAKHMVYACSSCHESFPHTPSGTTVPTMKSCFNCHGLRHGPMGLIAGNDCEQCHGDNVGKMRPAFHVSDWAQTPHVQPALDELQTSCMMCHTQKSCDDCHRKERVVWRTSTPFTYDVQNGCQACHGYQNLTKVSADGVQSFYVSGLDKSAHRDITCTQCHPDFNYTDEPPTTPLWQINAGLACQECHDHEEVALEYAESLHGKLIAEGDLTSATCASCHGGHDIALLDTEQAKLDLRLSGQQMCAPCHEEAYASYNDYYHGAPYKAKASDAPACWHCHGAHEVRALSDPESLMYRANAAETCGQEGCHYGSGESFIENSYDLIHGQTEVRATNPVIRWLRSLKNRV